MNVAEMAEHCSSTPRFNGPAPALTPQLDPRPDDPAPPAQPALQLLAGESGARGVAREQDFKLAEGDDAPRPHQGVEKREIIAQQVEQVDAALRAVRVQARRHAEKARVGLGAPAVRSGKGGRGVDSILLRRGCLREGKRTAARSITAGLVPVARRHSAGSCRRAER